MMRAGRIFFSRYALRSAGGLNAASARRKHEGALLRAGDGFGCLHPWPELGDASLDECLASLRRGVKNALARQALSCARADGAARAAGRSLFAGLAVPRSHATLTRLDSESAAAAAAGGFTVVKAKVGRDWPAEKKLLAEAMARFPDLRWRLDFNFRGNAAELREWGSLDCSRIDFLEDPFPSAGKIWEKFRAETGLVLALDREAGGWDSGAAGAGVVVLKPALQDAQKLARRVWGNRQRLVVTSYLGHPLEQCHAAFAAGKLAAQGAVDCCGLQTHGVYEASEFSERLGRVRPEFCPPGGTGLGFDDLLEKLTWKELK